MAMEGQMETVTVTAAMVSATGMAMEDAAAT